MTHSKEIRAAVASANRESREVELTDAQLAELGHGKRPLLKVIRSYCLRCMGDQPSMVRKCTSVACPLYVYRLGTNPFTGRRGNADALKSSTREPISEQGAEFSPKTGRPTGTNESGDVSPRKDRYESSTG